MEIKGFTKLNEVTAPELLKDEELVKLEDAVLDKELGRPLKRGGWERHNSNVADTGNILSLHEVVTSNGSNYLLAGINGKLRKSLNGTGSWSDVTDKGTPPYRMQPYADEFIFTDGNVPPFLVSGDSLGTVVDLEIAKPSDSEIALIYGSNASSGTGSLTPNKYYKYSIVYVTAKGDKSPPSNPFSYIPADPAVDFINMPVSSDPRVLYRYIYRTLANGDVYYFHSQINNIDTTFTDRLGDSDLGSDVLDFISAPIAGKYITLHKERIVLSNIQRTVKNWITPARFSHYSHANLVDESANALPSGTYQYLFVFYDKEGLQSDYIESNIVTIPGGSGEDEIALYLPLVGEDYDVIERAEIYRKFNGGNYQLLDSYDPKRIVTTGEYIDLNASVFHYLDDNTKTPTTIFASTQTSEIEKCGIAFSEIGQPATFKLEDIRNIFPDDGDEITESYDDQDGILVFKTRSICKIYTNGSPDNWRLVKLVTNIGCSEPNALLKYGNTYVFVSNGEIYKFNSNGGYENIGIEIWNTLDGVTVWHSSMADDTWYMFGVTGNMTKGYGFLVYDYLVGSWYIFNMSGIPYASLKDNNGDLLVSQGGYVCKYGKGETDTETGSSVDIVPILRTKTFGELISLVRLRKLRFNYKKMDNETITLTITNPDTAVTNTYTDSTNSVNASGFKLYETPIKDTDSLKETSKFYVNLTGSGFVEWGDLQITIKPILKGKRDG